MSKNIVSVHTQHPGASQIRKRILRIAEICHFGRVGILDCNGEDHVQNRQPFVTGKGRLIEGLIVLNNKIGSIDDGKMRVDHLHIRFHKLIR